MNHPRPNGRGIINQFMTIEEAIKDLERKIALAEMRNASENSTAVVKLSLEALKRIRKEREGTFTILLPGESLPRKDG